VTVAAVIDMTPELAAAELLRRRRARTSLVHYAQAIEIPGAPVSDDPDEALFRPIETTLARHHIVMLEAIQRTMERPRGRLMIFAPPGAAKSTYVSVVGTTWAMGRWPGHRIILTSYSAGIARKQSRRARQVVRSSAYRSIWPEMPALSSDSSAVDEWALSNGSEFMAAGLLGGITGNRAEGIVIDDPVAGREEADSQTMRDKTDDAYRDDLMMRVGPRTWVILIQTRWHEDDLAGRILPDDYDGRSGIIRCRDGQDWEVLCIPAKAERRDDPLGRKVGEYLWPEWFPREHWTSVENDPRSARTWSALMQQRPAPDSGTQFRREWFHWYDPQELPKSLRIYGASDYAVTEDEENDFTEHGVVGMDERGDLWFLDWWYDQVETDQSIAAFIALVQQWRPVQWWNEGGVIDKAVKPAINRAMREARTFVTIEPLPSIQDKTAKVRSFRARASARTVHLPRNKPWAARLLDQLVAFPAGRFDDGVDVCGLIGRGIDRMAEASRPPEAEPRGIKPFTEEWLMTDETEERPQPRYR